MSSVDMSTVDKIVKALDKNVNTVDILKIANFWPKLSRLLTFWKSASYSQF